MVGRVHSVRRAVSDRPARRVVGHAIPHAANGSLAIGAGAFLAIGMVPTLSATVLAWSAPEMRSLELVRMEPLERAQLWLDSWSVSSTRGRTATVQCLGGFHA